MTATRNVFFAAALAVLGVANATSAFAGTVGAYDSPALAAQSLRSRDAVVAESANLRAQAGFKATGETAEAPAVVTVANLALSRDAVRQQVAAAQAARTLPRQGEL